MFICTIINYILCSRNEQSLVQADFSPAQVNLPKTEAHMPRWRHPSPVLFLSVQSLNFVDKYQLEKNINISILQTEKRVKEINPIDLYRKSNPGLLGDCGTTVQTNRNRLSKNGETDDNKHVVQSFPGTSGGSINQAKRNHLRGAPLRKTSAIHFLTEGHACPRYRDYNQSKFEWTFDQSMPRPDCSPKLIEKYTKRRDGDTDANQQQSVKLLNIVPPIDLPMSNDDGTYTNPLSVLHAHSKDRSKLSKNMNYRRTHGFTATRSLSPFSLNFVQQMHDIQAAQEDIVSPEKRPGDYRYTPKIKVARLPPVTQTFPNHTFQGCKDIGHQQNCLERNVPYCGYRLPNSTTVPPLMADISEHQPSPPCQSQWQKSTAATTLSGGIPFDITITGRPGLLRPLSPIRMVAQAQNLNSPCCVSPDNNIMNLTSGKYAPGDNHTSYLPRDLPASRDPSSRGDSYFTINKLPSKSTGVSIHDTHKTIKLAPLRETTMENKSDGEKTSATKEHHVILPSVDSY